MMTDSVTKNLNIETLVAETLGSTHIPHHFLCTTHTSDKFDKCIMLVLLDIEKKISLREKLVLSCPQLKPFYRGKQCIVQCALFALCKLIAPAKSAKAATLSDEFDLLVEKEGRVKLVSLYQERKFTKLGTTAACVVNSIDLYQRLLDETPRQNLLVKACRLYINNEYILCALECLAYFTFKIGMPFLNMVELSSQKELKEHLPTLYGKLKGNDIEYLADYKVDWKRTKVDAPKSDLGKYIIKRMCEASAEGLRIQRGREYGFFGKTVSTTRATIVSELPDDELNLFPSNNIVCERNLLVAGVYMEKSSKCSNRFFKAKCVRDDVTLNKASMVKKIEGKLLSLLDAHESQWYKEQKQLNAHNIETLIEAGKNRDNGVDKLLAKCKSWNGPFLSVEEMEKEIVGKDEDQKRIMLRHEISFQKTTHPTDVLNRKELYLINKQPVTTMICNLGVILSTDIVNDEGDGEVLFPTEEDIIKLLNQPDQLSQQSQPSTSGSSTENTPKIIRYDIQIPSTSGSTSANATRTSPNRTFLH